MSKRGVVAGLVAGVIVAAGVAAAIPGVGGNETIYACYSTKNGAVRLVDEGVQCGRSELPTSWNQTGPQGDEGPPGEPGPATLDALAGSPCELPGGGVGEVSIAIAAEGTVSLACVITDVLYLHFDGDLIRDDPHSR
jgi:hypothetical protein